MSTVDDSITKAIDSARDGNAELFTEAIRALEADGWGLVQLPVATRFVSKLEPLLGTPPSVADIVNLARAVHSRVSKVANASVFDIEFLIRGYAGATLLAEAFPRNVAITLELAILGALEATEGFELGLPAFD